MTPFKHSYTELGVEFPTVLTPGIAMGSTTKCTHHISIACLRTMTFLVPRIRVESHEDLVFKSRELLDVPLTCLLKIFNVGKEGRFRTKHTYSIDALIM